MEATVVAGFDPEGTDSAAVDLAAWAARLLRGRLLVVVVRPGGAPAERLARVEQAGGHDARGLEAVRRRLRREEGELRVVEAPSPAAGLHGVLKAERPALAVLGTPERAPYGRVLAGSTTQRLIGGARCPLALVPRGYVQRPPRAAAVAVVPSPEGRAALRLAVALAVGAGIALRALMVLRRSPDAGEATALTRELRRPAGNGLVVDPSILVGDPADTLVRASAGVDLLVLGSRAYGPGGTVLAGGVARRVLAGAHCPVIVVPRDPLPE